MPFLRVNVICPPKLIGANILRVVEFKFEYYSGVTEYPADQGSNLFLKEYSLSNNTYDLYGNYALDGKVKIIDNVW